MFFLGGAAGIAGFAWTVAGWNVTCAAVALIGATAIFADVKQRRGVAPARIPTVD